MRDRRGDRHDAEPAAAAGSDWAGYQLALDGALAAIAAFGTRLLIVSFGADTFAGDPISHFAFERDDFTRLAARLAAMNVPSVVVMEGGYATAELGDNVAAFLSDGAWTCGMEIE